jgi:uncharacterized membrane protein
MNGQAQRSRLAHWVHRSLLSGILLSAAVLIAGLVIAFTNAQPRPEAKPPDFAQVPARIFHGEGAAWLDLGLVLLILTPVSRVAVLGVGWLIDRQWRFAAIAFCVLAILIASFVLGTG